MNTNIKISLNDLDRAKLLAWTGRTGLISRKDLTLLVLGLIEGIKDGTLKPISYEAIVESDESAEGPLEDEPETSGDRGFRGFVPSRGDEDYLTQPKDPGIAAACSRILDDTALIEKLTWETIERNRK
ncbi:unnamed protein product [marine sediment metagenome]|uniref:Uncharacterized protein n=1 Tax=marine sediment metagenome TaxID=412755 RepID=X0RYQ9_9ZZZZ